MARDPHRDQPIFTWGTPLGEAVTAMVMLHGRGGSVDDMRALATELDRAEVAFIAPAAAGRTWYPYSFLEPIKRNEPFLSSALRLVDRALAKASDAKVPAERVMLLGFSQGGCVMLEFTARNARRYGAVVGLSGGLIGPEGTPREYGARFEGTPGTNPEELLGAAHAGCFSMALSLQLGEAGIRPERIETKCTITFEKLDTGFTITRSHLDVAVRAPGADRAKFEAAAQNAKAGCPLSKVLKAEISMDARLAA